LFLQLVFYLVWSTYPAGMTDNKCGINQSTHPMLEQARKDICDRPDEEGIIMKWPTSVRQLLGKSKWEKRIADRIMATGVGQLGCALRDFEAERVERYDGW
jgi:hypothetical protein